MKMRLVNYIPTNNIGEASTIFTDLIDADYHPVYGEQGIFVYDDLDAALPPEGNKTMEEMAMEAVTDLGLMIQRYTDGVLPFMGYKEAEERYVKDMQKLRTFAASLTDLVLMKRNAA